MSHLSEIELSMAIKEIAKEIEVGETYVHFRSPDKPYIILALGLFEQNEEPCVVYKALYGEKLVWIRAVSKFLERVEHNGEKVPRFRKL